MKQQFVPYEIAIKLKEKGFAEQCLAYYDNAEYTLRPIDTDFVNFRSIGECIAAPLWQQVIDWLKSKGILIIEIWDGWEYAKLEEDFTYVQTKEQAIEHALTLI